MKQIKLFFVPTLFAVLSVLVMSSPCWATTYYVDATNGNDSNTGASEALPWKTIAKVNASNFQPGDFILFKRGEIWREQLNVPSSGAPGNPITIGAYGRGDKPQINGANLITSIWVEVENNVWQTSLKTDPRLVIFDDVYGKPQTLLSSLSADEDWYWSDDLDKLYVYSDSDPNGRNIEGYFYTFNLNIDGKDYITVQNIKFRVSGWNNIYIEGDADNITLDGVTTNHSYIAGVQTNTGDTEQINDLTIQNSTFAYAGKIGLDVVEVVDCLISTNAVHHNNLRGISTTHGIRVSQNVESTYYPTNVTIENNTSYMNGYFADGTEASASLTVGKGIHVDNAGSGVIVRYNSVYNNHADGIHLELMSNAQVYYNLSYNNTNSAGIVLSAWADYTLDGNLIYNNVCYGNKYGISAWGSIEQNKDQFTNNIFKNNICFGNTSRELFARWGGENDGTVGSGNVYEYNCFGAESSNFIEWGNGVYKSTYDAFETAYGSRTNSVESDPLMTDPDNDDFTLQSTSPAIDAGVNVGFAV